VSLLDLLRRTRVLLLDFDGPVCSVFAGYPAPKVAEELRAVVAARLGAVPATVAEARGPLSLIRRVADLGDLSLTRTVADACRDAEITAVTTAAPTPGTDDALRAAREAGRRVAIVSNNSAKAARTYLDAHHLSGYIDQITAREDGMDPRLLKPDPYLVQTALAGLDIVPTEAAFLGDSDSDIHAGHNAGTATIGYANKPGKRERLTQAGADIVIDTMTELADAIRYLAARP
jgi:HAD superfamily hydrolase (TIGR01509 family)